MEQALFTSSKQDWETPDWLFKELDKLFNFDIDVCAIEENAKCSRYFSPGIDGLKQDWQGCCWMNPPYGRDIKLWIEKAHQESLNGNTVVCLIPARVDTKIWQDVIFPNAKAICFIKGRLQFGNSNINAPFPSSLLVFGEVTKEQIEYMKTLGKLIIHDDMGGK